MKNSEEFNGVVPAKHILEVTTDVDNKEFNENDAKFAFDIVTKDRTFHVAARISLSLKSWVEAVQAVIDNNLSDASSESCVSVRRKQPFRIKEKQLLAKAVSQQEASPYADILSDSLGDLTPSSHTTL